MYWDGWHVPFEFLLRNFGYLLEEILIGSILLWSGDDHPNYEKLFIKIIFISYKNHWIIVFLLILFLRKTLKKFIFS